MFIALLPLAVFMFTLLHLELNPETRHHPTDPRSGQPKSMHPRLFHKDRPFESSFAVNVYKVKWTAFTRRPGIHKMSRNINMKKKKRRKRKKEKDTKEKRDRESDVRLSNISHSTIFAWD